jgi:hypothetical protein
MSKKCIYLGFKVAVKGHILFDLLLSRDVIFVDSFFSYHFISPNNDASPIIYASDSHQIFDDITFHNTTHHHPHTSHNTRPSQPDISLTPDTSSIQSYL